MRADFDEQKERSSDNPSGTSTSFFHTSVTLRRVTNEQKLAYKHIGYTHGTPQIKKEKRETRGHHMLLVTRLSNIHHIKSHAGTQRALYHI